MTAESKPSNRPATSSYVPYSDWSQGSIERIKVLSDECLDRFKEDKKLNTEILKMLCKLETLIQKKYSE